MKLTLSLLIALLALTAAAQPRPPQDGHQPPPKEERLKQVSARLKADLKLNAAQLQQVKNAYSSFFDAIEKQKKAQGSMEGPPGGPPLPKEQMDKLTARRDLLVKKALTAAQYKKYVVIEQSMRPRPPGPPQGN